MCTPKIISSFAPRIRIISIKTSVTFLLVNPGAYAGFLKGGGANSKKFWKLDIHAAKRHVASSEAASRC